MLVFFFFYKCLMKLIKFFQLITRVLALNKTKKDERQLLIQNFEW